MNILNYYPYIENIFTMQKYIPKQHKKMNKTIYFVRCVQVISPIEYKCYLNCL